MHYLEEELSKQIHFIETIKVSSREHFVSISRLQKKLAIPGLELRTLRELQNSYPTREAWQKAKMNKVVSIVNQDDDFANLILQRINKWLQRENI